MTYHFLCDETCSGVPLRRRFRDLDADLDRDDV